MKFSNCVKHYASYLLFLLYALLRLLILFTYPLSYAPHSDSYDYLLASSLPLTHLSAYYSIPLSYLGVLKLASQNISIIFAIQLLVSIFAWWFVTVWLYKQLKAKNMTVAWIISVVVLLFSCSLKLSQWDSLILTESLTVSYFILYLYSYFSFLETDGQKQILGICICVAMLLFLNQRTANAYLLVFCIPLYVIQYVMLKNKINRLFCLSFIIISLVGFTFVTWATNQSDIWKSSMGNIFSTHVARYPDAIDYFTQHGMPDDIRKQLDSWSNQSFEPAFYSGKKFFQDPNAPSWIIADSRKIYTEYLLTHPAYLLSPFSLSSNKPNNLHMSAHALFSLTGDEYGRTYGEPKIYFIYNIVKIFSMIYDKIFILLFSVLLLLVCKYWRYLSSFTMLAAFYYFFLSIPLFLFIWHADAGEPARHQLMVYVISFISLVLSLGIIVRLVPSNKI